MPVLIFGVRSEKSQIAKFLNFHASVIRSVGRLAFAFVLRRMNLIALEDGGSPFDPRNLAPEPTNKNPERLGLLGSQCSAMRLRPVDGEWKHNVISSANREFQS
jgi:hypothetical protein